MQRWSAWETTWVRPPVALLAPLALLAYVAAWTLAATLTYPSLHHDMLEAWVWSQHPALGYYKHPPLSALLPAIWFCVLPRQDWAFYLLAYTNAAAGLWGVWMIAGRLLPDRSRSLAVLLLGLTPFFTFSAAKFNANTVLLSVWPLTVWMLIRSLDLRSAASGMALGLLAALALLAKYYSVLLLGPCVLASLLHPRAREYWRSPAPYAAVVVFLFAIAPHLVWLVRNDFQTFTYAEHTMRLGLAAIIGRATWAMISAVVLHIPVLVALALALGNERRRCWARLVSAAAERHNRWFVVLALGPYVLTYLACLVADVRISLQFMIPAFFLWPLTILHLAGCDVPARGVRNIARAVITVAIVAVFAAPVIAIFNLKWGYPAFAEPRKTVAAEATRLWHERFSRPLAIVAGEQGYAQGIVFYGSDATSELSDFRYEYSPWITPRQVAEQGMLVVCSAHFDWCTRMRDRMAAAGAEVVERTYPVQEWGVRGTPQTVLFILQPPAP